MPIGELALRLRLPGVFPRPQYVRAGGLMSYGPNLPQTLKRMAVYVDRILKGAKPGDLPIEQPTSSDLTLNLGTARVLGLTIPQSVLVLVTALVALQKLTLPALPPRLPADRPALATARWKEETMTRMPTVLACLLFAATVLVPPGDSAGQQPEFKLRFGGSDPGRGLLDKTTLKFVELSEKKSNGRLKWEYFCCDQLGGDIAQIEQLMANSIQAYGDVLDWWANWVKDFAIFGWGFAFRDHDHFAKFLESPTYTDMADRLRTQNGLRILAAGPTEPRMLWTKKPVTSLADMKGMKMRVPEIKAYLMVWEALETKPSRVTWGEVYLAMKTGVVDGAEGPISATYGVKFHEAAPNGYLTNHIISSAHVTINEKTYQSLPPDLRKAVEEAARESVAWARSEAQKVAEETLQRMKAEGARIGSIDTGPFQARLREAVSKAEAESLWTRGLWQKVQDVK